MAKTSMFVKLSAQDGKRDDLLAALDRMLVAVNEEAGTEIYAFNLDTTDDNAIWIYELYTDADALAAHSSSDAMATLLGEVGGLLGDAPLMVTTTPVSGKGIGL
jgi:quinol monooxygenase YgiN